MQGMNMRLQYCTATCVVLYCTATYIALYVTAMFTFTALPLSNHNTYVHAGGHEQSQ